MRYQHFSGVTSKSLWRKLGIFEPRGMNENCELHSSSELYSEEGSEAEFILGKSSAYKIKIYAINRQFQDMIHWYLTGTLNIVFCLSIAQLAEECFTVSTGEGNMTFKYLYKFVFA